MNQQEITNLRDLLEAKDDENILLGLQILASFPNILSSHFLEYLLAKLMLSECNDVKCKILEILKACVTKRLYSVAIKLANSSMLPLNLLREVQDIDLPELCNLLYNNLEHVYDPLDIAWFMIDNFIRIEKPYQKESILIDIEYEFCYIDYYQISLDYPLAYLQDKEQEDSLADYYENEWYKSTGILGKDFVNYTLLNHYEGGFENIDTDGEDDIDRLFKQIPTLRKYERIIIDEGLRLNFCLDF